MTYENILSRMKAQYRELSGFDADNASDIGIRLKIFAAEMAEYYARLGELERQVFPRTSGGKYLEFHAETKAVFRKPGLKAAGSLRFLRETPAYNDIVIPAGVVCATRPQNNEAQLRFVTTSETVLHAGELFADAPAEADAAGGGGNIAARAVCVMITPAAGVSAVENPEPFSGGADQESDESLRERLLLAYKNISNGTNSAFYHDIAISHEGVGSVNVLPRRRGRGTVDVVVDCRDPDAGDEIISALQSELGVRKEINVDVLVLAARKVTRAVAVEITPLPGHDRNMVSENVKEETVRFLNGLGVGNPLLLASLGSRILNVEGVYNYSLSAPERDYFPAEDEVIRPGTVSVTGMAVG